MIATFYNHAWRKKTKQKCTINHLSRMRINMQLKYVYSRKNTKTHMVFILMAAAEHNRCFFNENIKKKEPS